MLLGNLKLARLTVQLYEVGLPCSIHCNNMTKISNRIYYLFFMIYFFVFDNISA